MKSLSLRAGLTPSSCARPAFSSRQAGEEHGNDDPSNEEKCRWNDRRRSKRITLIPDGFHAADSTTTTRVSRPRIP
jgi:hypothetical protein